MKTLVSKWRGNTLAQNTVWMFLGQGLRLVIQAVYFIIIARALGPDQYGLFAAVLAIASILAPFVGIGSDKLLIRHVANEPSEMGACFANGIVLTLASGTLACAVAVAFSRFLLPISATTLIVLLVSVSDLLCFRLLDLAAAAFQGLERMRQTALVSITMSAMRLLAIAVMASMLHHASAVAWSAGYAAASVAAVIIALFSVRGVVAQPRISLPMMRRNLAVGFAFSFGQSAQSIYNDIDKTMVARLASIDAAGIYAAAYRIVDVAFTPVRSLVLAAYPSFFRFGANLDGAYAYAKSLLRKPVLFSVIAALAIFLAAPLLPRIVGADYARAVEALRWLCVLPVLKSVQYFFADALTGAGYQAWRMVVQVAVAIFNVLINLWIIPAYSWRGAAWSSVASDGLLVALLWMLILILKRSAVPVAGEQLLSSVQVQD